MTNLTLKEPLGSFVKAPHTLITSVFIKLKRKWKDTELTSVFKINGLKNALANAKKYIKYTLRDREVWKSEK